MSRYIFSLIAVLLLHGCSSSSETEESTYDEDLARLQATFTMLERESASVTCTDPAEWDFALVGSKACGGHQTALPYHSSIATSFLAAVDDYTAQQQAFNETYGLPSNCAIEPIPQNVVCMDGEAQLIY